MKEIANLIKKTDRPLIYAGHGCTLYRDQFLEFVEFMCIPVMLSWRAIDLLPETHEWYWGRPGLIAQPEANKKMAKATLVLILGARVDDMLTCYHPNDFLPNAQKIVIDIDLAELERLSNINQTARGYDCIQMDVGDFMKELMEAMK